MEKKTEVRFVSRLVKAATVTLSQLRQLLEPSVCSPQLL